MSRAWATFRTDAFDALEAGGILDDPPSPGEALAHWLSVRLAERGHGTGEIPKPEDGGWTLGFCVAGQRCRCHLRDRDPSGTPDGVWALAVRRSGAGFFRRLLGMRPPEASPASLLAVHACLEELPGVGHLAWYEQATFAAGDDSRGIPNPTGEGALASEERGWIDEFLDNLEAREEPIDQARLATLELALGATLPTQYRRYLLTTNGARPKHRIVDTGDDFDADFHTALGLDDGEYYRQLDKNWLTLRERMPDTLLPFGGDSGGNECCIAVKGERRGTIYFWDHELEGEEQPYWENITKVSDSFAGFLQCLRDSTDEELGYSPPMLLIHHGDLEGLKALLDEGLPLDAPDESCCGRTLIEEAAVKARDDIIRELARRGAKLGTALDFAQMNAQYFESHKSTVALLQELGATEARRD